jgi:hypothetical protein
VEGLEPGNKNAGNQNSIPAVATFCPDSIVVFNDQLLDDGFTQEQVDQILAALQDCMALNQES